MGRPTARRDSARDAEAAGWSSQAWNSTLSRTQAWRFRESLEEERWTDEMVIVGAQTAQSRGRCWRLVLHPRVVLALLVVQALALVRHLKLLVKYILPPILIRPLEVRAMAGFGLYGEATACCACCGLAQLVNRVPRNAVRRKVTISRRLVKVCKSG